MGISLSVSRAYLVICKLAKKWYLMRMCINRLCFFNAAKFISHILGGNSTLHQDLKSLLSAVTCPESRWTRCYRAIDDGWSAAAFHANCDYRGASVTLVEVNGYIFGGYLDQSWGGKYRMFLALRLL